MDELGSRNLAEQPFYAEKECLGVLEVIAVNDNAYVGPKAEVRSVHSAEVSNTSID